MYYHIVGIILIETTKRNKSHITYEIEHIVQLNLVDIVHYYIIIDR